MRNFIKMHSFGNSFIFINTSDIAHEIITPELVTKLCNHHFGIGADGLVFYNNEQMRIFNQDGSEAEMCGNACRCLTSIIVPNYQKKKISTLGGIIELEHLEKQVRITLNLENIPKIIPINVGIPGHYLTVGVPHFIVFLTDQKSPPELDQLGKKISQHPFFSKGTNVDFVTYLENDIWKLTTWERGVGLSLACGTGAMSVGVLNAFLFGKATSHIQYEKYSIQAIFFDKKVSLTGDLPEKIAEGTTCLI